MFVVHLTRITLAVEDVDLMVRFYNEIFDCGLVPISGSPLAKGMLVGIEFVICPNSLAQVIADQNRHQLRIGVDDPEALALRAERAGGSVVIDHGMRPRSLASPTLRATPTNSSILQPSQIEPTESRSLKTSIETPDTCPSTPVVRHTAELIPQSQSCRPWATWTSFQRGVDRRRRCAPFRSRTRSA